MCFYLLNLAALARGPMYMCICVCLNVCPCVTYGATLTSIFRPSQPRSPLGQCPSQPTRGPQPLSWRQAGTGLLTVGGAHWDWAEVRHTSFPHLWPDVSEGPQQTWALAAYRRTSSIMRLLLAFPPLSLLASSSHLLLLLTPASSGHLPK